MFAPGEPPTWWRRLQSMPADEPRTRPHYHPVGIFFHWTMALLVFVQVGLGWWTWAMPAGFDKLTAYSVHTLIGVVLLAFAGMRASWRLVAPFVLPELEKPEDLPGWQKVAAEATHIALYVLMFALPLSGWIMLSAALSGQSLPLPGGYSWPALPFTSNLAFVARAHLEQNAEIAHLVMVWMLMALVAIHIGAALKHHFIDGDDVLARMIPVLGRGEAFSRGKSREAAPAKAAR